MWNRLIGVGDENNREIEARRRFENGFFDGLGAGVGVDPDFVWFDFHIYSDNLAWKDLIWLPFID